MRRIIYPNGDIYEGEVHENVRHGWGRYIYTSRRMPCYEGEWRGGHKQGFGTFFEAERKCMAGSWRHDRLHGLAMTVSSGERFVGFFQRGRRAGYGKHCTIHETVVGTWHGLRQEGPALVFSHRTGKLHCKRFAEGKCVSKVNVDAVLAMTPLPAEASRELRTAADRRLSFHRSVNSRVRRLSGRIVRRLSQPAPHDSQKIATMCSGLAARGIANWSAADLRQLLALLDLAEPLGPVVEEHQLDGEALLALLRLSATELDGDVFCRELGIPNDAAAWFFLNCCRELVKLEYRRKERIGQLIPKASFSGGTPTTQDSDASSPGGESTLRHFLPDFGGFEFALEDLKPVGVLGQGGFGRVERFRSASMHIDLAGKELKREFLHVRASDASYHHVRALREFVNELNLLKSLRHPNITLLLGVCLDPRRPLMLTEFVKDGSLMDYLHKKRHVFDRVQILSVCRDICAAMEYLHNEHVLHCDLKSSNVLVIAVPTSFRAKICDFGLARSLTTSTTLGGPFGVVENILSMEDAAYEVGHEVGTPHWMAPEVLRGNPHTTAADVYGFGLVLWEMLTNTIPFQHIKTSVVGAAVGYGRLRLPRPQTAFNNADDLVHILRRCTEFDAHLRPSFATLHTEFAQLLKNEEKQQKFLSARSRSSSNLFRFLKRSASVRDSHSTLAESDRPSF